LLAVTAILLGTGVLLRFTEVGQHVTNLVVLQLSPTRGTTSKPTENADAAGGTFETQNVEPQFATASDSDSGIAIAALMRQGTNEDDRAETSWQNPFRPSLWFSRAWTFSQDEMTATADEATTAIFLRPYRTLSLEARIDAGNLASDFSIELFSRAAPTDRLVIDFHADGVSATAHHKGKQTLLRRREAPLPPTEAVGLLRFGVTSQRVRVVWNDRNVLLFSLPQEWQGREKLIGLTTGKRSSPLKILSLRIEGVP